MTHVTVKLSLINVAVLRDQFTVSPTLTIREDALKDAPIWEVQLTVAILSTPLVPPLEARPISMGLYTLTMGQSRVPLTLISGATLTFDHLPASMTLTMVELPLIGISVWELLLALAMRDTLLPLTLILLAIRSCHLALAVALSVLEPAFVNVAVGE